MPLELEAHQRAKATRYFLLGWNPDAVAHEIRCSERTIYRIHANLMMHGSHSKPRLRTMGCPRKLTPYDEDLLIDFLARYPTSTLPEMSWFIWEERGILVSDSTISRVLKGKEVVEEEGTP